MYFRNLTRVAFAIAALAGATFLRADEKPFDQPPTPLRTVAPSYPHELRVAGVSGMVAVSVLIDDQGNVAEKTVSKSSHPGFEQPALEAVAQWKFKPATKAGQAVSVRVVVPVKFNTNS